MKKYSVIIALVLLFMAVIPAQAGILPGSQQAFGYYMPSIGLALNRQAVSDESAGESRVLTYSPFTDADYVSFGQYVKAWGCTAGEYQSNEASVTIPLTKGEASITFTYCRAEGTASLTYPKGTRPEEQKAAATSGQNAFPALRNVFGRQMPSLNAVVGKKADQSSGDSDSELVQQYSGVTEARFDAFNAYAAEMGCTLSGQSVSGSVVTLTYQNGNALMTLVYDDEALTAKVTYSTDAWYDDAVFARADTAGALITADEIFGVYAPNAAKVLKRQADSVEQEARGTAYVYNNFTDADYDAFGNYMMESGCTVTGYTTEGEALIIQVEKAGSAFTFIYERDTHTGKVIYPKGTRAERVALATPTPKPTATPKPTPKPTATPKPTVAPKNYTPNQCYDIAIRYIKGVLLNPQSYQEHNCTYRTYEGYYTFTIDYSAMNRMGGYERETYIIEVNYSTGTIQSAFSF